MQIAAGDDPVRARDVENAAHDAVVDELVRLAEHVQNSLRLVERTIDDEAVTGYIHSSIDIVVLDDVAPRYGRAVAALRACDARLGDALRAQLDSDQNARLPARLPALSAHGA
jgi:hypothetical protein